MKWLLVLVLTVFVGGFFWRIFSLLSSDAIAMALGMLLGTFGAMLPIAALILLDRREVEQVRDYDDPPVIVVYLPLPPESSTPSIEGYLYGRANNLQSLFPQQSPAEVKRIYREQLGTQAEHISRSFHNS